MEIQKSTKKCKKRRRRREKKKKREERERRERDGGVPERRLIESSVLPIGPGACAESQRLDTGRERSELCGRE